MSSDNLVNPEERSKLTSFLESLKKVLKFILNLKNKFFDWIIQTEKILILKEMLKIVTSFDDFKKYSLELDKLEGKEEWKMQKETRLYDYKEVEFLIKTLKNKKESNDFSGLVHYLRSNLVKNLYSTNNPLLYHRSHFGTKYLIEDFENEIISSLKYIYKYNEKLFPLYKKIEFFSETRHAYGRTALLLSGGASFGMYHLGVIKALHEQNLIPKVICGSSAGSIVASIVCVTPKEEVLKRLEQDLISGPLAIKGMNLSFFQRIFRYLLTDSVFNVEHLKDFLRDNIGDLTFQEAYDKTGWILNITVTGYKEHDNHRLMNYLTAPNVLIWSAACASSALPGMFDPVELHCKNEYGQIVPYSKNRSKFIDGSISQDLPMQRVSELFNVNSFIVSQTNPFAIPFLDKEDGGGMTGSKTISFYKLLKNLIGSEIKLRISQLCSFGIIPTNMGRYLNLFAQDFRGNVTIFPVPVNFIEFTKIVSNPTKQFLEKCKVYGGRKTYPKICKIDHLVKIENALEKFYRKVKVKLNSKIIEKAVKSEKLETKFNSNLNDPDDISENEDIDLISEKHDTFIIYKDINENPCHDKRFVNITIKNIKDSNNDNLVLTRNQSYSTPRIVTIVNNNK